MHHPRATPQFFLRKRLRRPGWDYSSDGYYFITICTHESARSLGSIQSGRVTLSSWGEAVAYSWVDLPAHSPWVTLEGFVIMPDHVHALLGLRNSPQTLGLIVALFKAASTRAINIMRNRPGGRVWHRAFHDQIIWDERHLSAVRRYIIYNPSKWQHG